ncbi:NTP transferase domain-containing protein [Pseudomonas sp. BN411]|uniref:NTP transferase domain-containing protein n=1 Tax=Pseudomonas sp. BN411 TaxID=2567887 RepID=UPI002455EA53|nr:NTP transferase domain-containing protein [Pseudomonas sp. BN411]
MSHLAITRRQPVQDLTVVILAAESGHKRERWELAETPKQLIEVRGETLLGRTLRLLGEGGIEPAWLITTSAAFAGFPATSWCPMHCETKAHSLLAGLSLWQDGDLLVLYSDVYYTKAAFETILRGTGTRFFGREGRSAFTFKNYGELFAIRIACKDKHRASQALEALISHHALTGNESFWGFYRLMAGLPLADCKAFERKYFVQLHDETDDVDFASEVPRLQEAIEKPIRWRARYLVRRLSLLNKQRRDRSRQSAVVRRQRQRPN